MLMSGTVEMIEFVLIPVIIGYTVFADYVIWNLFEGKRKPLIWIIESIVSLLIILLTL